MASRTNFQMESRDRGVFTMHGRVVIGATGSVPAVGANNNCRGFVLTRTGVGAYTITLADKYKAAVGKNGVVTSPNLLSFIELEDSTGGGGGAAGATLVPSVKLDSSASPTGTITFTCLLSSSSAAGDPANGTVMKIMLFMRNSITPPIGV